MSERIGNIINPTGLIFCVDALDKNSYSGTGSTWYDLVSGINGTITNAIWEPEGRFDFDNSGDYIQFLSNGSGSIFDTQTYTIEIWALYQNEGSYDMLWSYDYTAHTTPYYAQHVRFNASANDGKVIFAWNNAGVYGSGTSTVESGAVLTAQNWYHVVCTKTTTSAKIYLNGVEVASYSPNSSVTYYSQEVWAGKSNFSTGDLGGKIAAINFYNRVLNAAEIKKNFNAKRSRFGL